MVNAQHDILAIFTEAIRLDSPELRSDYLAEACSGEPIVRQRVETLLRAHFDAGKFLGDSPGATTPAEQTLSEKPGAIIGHYKLLEQIGEGGMGVVYVAEQTEPVRRRIALKIIKPGMDTKQVIARFEAERQALAMMDHPNIAKVLDAGASETGRPYFVMELVRGLPITEYCDKARLNPRQRLGLFIDVCHAVQHAHQKGIIHRDLKPSNVMITVHDGRPIPKVIDFGVAKAVGQQLTQQTVYTAHTQLIGTPLYMSPEQADLSSQDVDTRSDVYSLGVLLYELLTGQTPFDKDTLHNVGFDEMRRIIREDDPPKPSHRISTLSAQASSTISHQRGLDERHLGHMLRGELDWIVMRALEKDRSRRFESASALAADIQRYLSDEPVLACPPTAMYRLHKFARKHKPTLATAAGIALCLIVGTTVSAWQAARAIQAEAQAKANEVQAKESAQQAKQKTDEANTERDDAQRQRDEVKALYEKLAAKEQELQRALYASNVNLAKHAWDAGNFGRTRELLQQTRPQSGEPDFRGFEWHYLSRLSHAELLTISGARSVHSVAFSPDGKHVATAGRPGIKIWDIRTGRELHSLKGGASASGDFRKCLAYSPDGKRLAGFGGDTAGSGGSRPMTVWSAETGEVLFTITAECLSVAFSPDGKRLATAGWAPDGARAGGEAKIRDSDTGKELFTLAGARGGVAFSPDGKRIFSGTKVWDAQSGEELLSLKGHVGSVSTLAYSADGNRLASASYSDKTLKVWDAQSGQELLTLTGSTGRCVCISPDSKRVATAWVDNSVKVFDITSGQALLSFKGQDSVNDIAFSPDGKRLICGGDTLQVWDANKDQQPLAFKGSDGYRVSSVAFSPDGKHLASAAVIGPPWTATQPGAGTWWNAATGEPIFSLTGHTRGINAVAISPNGKWLASVSLQRKGQAGEVNIWNAETGDEVSSLSFKGSVGNQQSASVSFTPDGRHVVTCGGENWPVGPGEVKIWDVASGNELRSIKEPEYVQYVAYSPDGKYLAGCMRGVRTVKLWDAETGQRLREFSGGEGATAFSPDGKRLASGSYIWDVETGRQLLILKGHADWIDQTVFSPDGQRLATVSKDDSVKLWDAQTGAELMTLAGRDVVAFSTDGHRLATANDAGSVIIYDATPLPAKP